MKIIIDDKIPYIKEAAEKIADEAIYAPGKDFTRELVQDADALIIRTRTHCNRELLEGSKVKFIATATIGFDHIDTEYCKQAGIEWANVLAMANPNPEIMYDEAMAAGVKVMGTGRSDFPNQINNVSGFPYIFRGALDVEATEINEAMKIAAAEALAALAKEPVPAEVCSAYNVDSLEYGFDYIIPKPLDPRILTCITPAGV